MQKSKYLIYLAGPITGLSFDGCVDWREKVCEMLPTAIVGLSPMRGKHFLSNETEIKYSYEDTPLACARGIMTRDFNDCCRCDVVIANFLGAEKVSVGTVMEIAWAYNRRIPVIAVIEKTGNPHDHPMMSEAFGYRVETLEEAVDIATVVLLPSPHRK